MHRSPGSVLMKRALALASSSILPLAVGQRIMCPQCIECVQCGGVKCSATSSLPPVPSQPTQDSFYRRTLPVGLVDFSSPKGKKYFADAFTAGTAESFFPLVSQYQTQSHPALCGLTTLTIMLNALKIDPARVWMHPWRWFAESLLDCCLDLDSAKTAGVTMDQLAQTGRCNRADIRVIRNITEEEARTLILSGVQQQTPGSDMFVAVSYSRQALNQTGDGHYSPVAAFDEKSDSVLILDTARFKYGPYWVKFKELYKATLPVDPACGKPRGFMTFRRADNMEEPNKFCKQDSCGCQTESHLTNTQKGM